MKYPVAGIGIMMAPRCVFLPPFVLKEISVQLYCILTAMAWNFKKRKGHIKCMRVILKKGD